MILAEKIRERYAAIRALEKQAETQVRDLRNMVSMEIVRVRLNEKRDVLDDIDPEAKSMLVYLMSNYIKVWAQK